MRLEVIRVLVVIELVRATSRCARCKARQPECGVLPDMLRPRSLIAHDGQQRWPHDRTVCEDSRNDGSDAGVRVAGPREIGEKPRRFSRRHRAEIVRLSIARCTDPRLDTLRSALALRKAHFHGARLASPHVPAAI